MSSSKRTGQALSVVIAQHHTAYLKGWSPVIKKISSGAAANEIQQQAMEMPTVHKKINDESVRLDVFRGFEKTKGVITNIPLDYLDDSVGAAWLIVKPSSCANEKVDIQEIEAYAKSLGSAISLNTNINGVFGCACPSHLLMNSYRKHVNNEKVLFAALVGTAEGLRQAIKDGLAYENELFMPHGASSDDPVMPYLTRRCQDIGIIKSISW